MRNELKFKGKYNYLREMIINSNYQVHHQKRFINSIYLDDSNFKLFNQSEEGIVPRFKLRYRWYGETNYSKSGNLEKKITYENYRDKKIRQTKECDFKRISELMNNAYGYYFYPILKVKYCREYFIDFNSNRVTLDSDIKFYRVLDDGKFYDEMSEIDSVLEFKIETNQDENLIFPTIHNLKTRYSKYCEGIRNCYNLNS